MISCKNIIDVALLIKFKVRECSNFYFRGVKTKVKKKIIYILKKLKKKLTNRGVHLNPWLDHNVAPDSSKALASITKSLMDLEFA